MAQEDDMNAAALRKARLDDEENDDPLVLEREAGSSASTKDHTVTFVLAFLVAVFSDLADIFVIGAIPIVGDALDAATGAILAALFLSIGGRRTIGATLFEFLPFGITDIMPTFTLEVIYTWYMVTKENRAED